MTKGSACALAAILLFTSAVNAIPMSVVPTPPATGPGVYAIDLPGSVGSWDEYYDLDNEWLVIDVGGITGLGNNTAINGVGWDVTITTLGTSYLEEAVISFENASGADWHDAVPGLGDDFSGTASYDSGGISEWTYIPLSNGQLWIEFYELWDDYPDDIDAYVSGTLFISVVPEPASLSLLALSSLAIIRRKRA